MKRIPFCFRSTWKNPKPLKLLDPLFYIYAYKADKHVDNITQKLA